MSKKQFSSTPFWMIYDLMVNYMEIQDFVELPCISLFRYTWNDTENVLENCETILEKVLEKCLNFFSENLYSPWEYNSRMWTHTWHPIPRSEAELWSVFCEDFQENWPCHNSNALYYAGYGAWRQVKCWTPSSTTAKQSSIYGSATASWSRVPKTAPSPSGTCSRQQKSTCGECWLVTEQLSMWWTLTANTLCQLRETELSR